MAISVIGTFGFLLQGDGVSTVKEINLTNAIKNSNISGSPTGIASLPVTFGPVTGELSGDKLTLTFATAPPAELGSFNVGLEF